MSWLRRRKDDLMHYKDRDYGDASCGAHRDVAVTRDKALLSCPVCREIVGLPA